MGLQEHTYRLSLDGLSGIVSDPSRGDPVEFDLTDLQCKVLDACEVPRPRSHVLRLCTASFSAQHVENTIGDLLSAGLLIDIDDRLVTLPIRTFEYRMLCLAGPTCAGKSTAVAEACAGGFESFDVGAELERRYGRALAYLDPIPRLAAIGNGDSVLGGLHDPIEQKLRSGKPVIIDSVKASGDVPTLARAFPGAGILVLGISAPLEVRRQRFHRRNRPGDERSMDMKDEKLLSIGVDRVIKNVDVEIVNDGNQMRFRTTLAQFFERARTSSTLAFWRRGGNGGAE